MLAPKSRQEGGLDLPNVEKESKNETGGPKRGEEKEGRAHVHTVMHLALLPHRTPRGQRVSYDKLCATTSSPAWSMRISRPWAKASLSRLGKTLRYNSHRDATA